MPRPATSARERFRELAAAARSVSSTLDLRAILETVLGAVMSLRADLRCAIRLVDRAAAGYRLAASAGRGVSERAAVVPFGAGTSHVVATTQRALLIHDIADDPRTFAASWCIERGLTVYYGAPIEAAGEVLGVLNVFFPTGAPPSEDEQELIDLLAGLAAVAIRNSRLFAESEARRHAAEALADVSRLLTQTLDSVAAGQLVTDNVCRLLGARSSVVYRLEPASGDLVAVGISSDVGETFHWTPRLSAGAGLVGIALERRASVTSTDVLNDPRITYRPETRDAIAAATHRALLAVPLAMQERMFGVLAVGDRTGRVFDEEQVRLAEAFAAQAALALENSRLYGEAERRRREAETSEARYRRLFDGVPIGVMQTDVEGRIGAANAAMVRMLGYASASALVGMNVEDLYVDVDDRKRLHARVDRGLAEHGVELRWRRVDGRVVWVLARVRGVPEADGRVRHYEAAVEDLTERKRAEEALAAIVAGTSGATGEEFFRSLVPHLASALGVRYAFVAEIIGDARDRLRSIAVWEGAGPGPTFEVRLTATPCGAVCAGRTAFHATGVRDRFPESSWLGDMQVDSYLGVPIFSSTGEILGVLAVLDEAPMSDAATAEPVMRIFAARAGAELERQRAEDALRESHGRLSSLVEASPLPIWVLDPGGRVTVWNRAAERVFGWAEPEVLGRLLPIVPEDRLGEYRLNLARALAGDFTNVEAERRCKDGTAIEITMSSAPLHGAAGQLEGVITVAVDLRDRKRLEAELRQLQKMEAIGRLAGGVAHDFNNLLTIISGRAELLLRRTQDDDRSRRDVEMIHKTAARAATLTRQLLAFSRRQILHPKIVDLNELLGGTVTMLQRLIREDIELVFVPGPRLGAIHADPGQIELVLMNLAVNASDAMPRGGRLVLGTHNVELDAEYLRRHVDARPGCYVRLAVTDTGVGMTPDVRARIFEPFFTTKEPGKGTGLGLATVYGIVKQSDGDIEVESEPGRGTTFSIYLPRMDAAPDVDAPAAEADEAARGTETILLVEDEPGVRELAREILTAHGYSVLEADGAAAALALASRHRGRIDVLLTDVVMPGGSGRRVAEELRTLHPEARTLYMSGYPDDAIVHHGVLDAGTLLIEKPVSASTLARRVRALLDGPRH